MKFKSSALLIVFLISTLGESAFARLMSNKKQTFAFSTYYSTYHNVSVGSAESKSLPSSLDLEIALRLNSIFSLTLQGLQFQTASASETDLIQEEIKAYGLGIKIDLPGFLFYGGDRRDFSRAYKRYPANSSIFLDVIKVEANDANGTMVTSVSNRYGIAMDFFLFNPLVYLCVQFGGISYQADTQSFYGVGLGATF